MESRYLCRYVLQFTAVSVDTDCIMERSKESIQVLDAPGHGQGRRGRQ